MDAHEALRRPEAMGEKPVRMSKTLGVDPATAYEARMEEPQAS